MLPQVKLLFDLLLRFYRCFFLSLIRGLHEKVSGGERTGESGRRRGGEKRREKEGKRERGRKGGKGVTMRGEVHLGPSESSMFSELVLMGCLFWTKMSLNFRSATFLGL